MLLVVVYVVVALANYSIVQSLAGSVVSSYLSKDWGGKVHVGSMNVNLLNSVKLHNVQLITPGNDTVANLERVVVRYNESPIQADGLHLKSVYIKHGYFHLHDKEDGLTVTQFIKYLQRRFASQKKKEEHGREHPFVVRVETVLLRNIHYKQTLRDPGKPRSVTGITVPDMDFTDVNFKARNVRVEGGPRITLRMERFSAQEVSGMNVRSLKMNVYVAQDAISATNLELKTDSSQVFCDVLMRYNKFHSFGEFCDSVVFHVNMKEGTSCNMCDAAYWTHTLWGLDEQIALCGQVYGPISNLRADRMTVALGNVTKLDFDGNVQGLPHIDNTAMYVNMRDLHTAYNDLTDIHWNEKVHVKVPSILKELGTIHATASLHGGLKDFMASAEVGTMLGDVNANVVLHHDQATKDYHYAVKALSTNFQLSRVVNNKWVSRTGFDITAQGHGFHLRTMEAKADAVLAHTMLRGVPLDVSHVNISANKGVVTADVKISDSLAKVDVWAVADLRDSMGSYEVSGNVKHLDLARLHLWNRAEDSTATLSVQLQSHLYGSRPENMYGTVVLDNTRLALNNNAVILKSTALNVRTIGDYKNIMLNSDIANMAVKGYFKYADVPLMIQKFCSDYVPRYYTKKTKVVNFDRLATAEMEFNVLWTDTLDQMAILAPKVMVAPGTTLQGNYNFTEQLKMVLRSDSISMSGFTLYDIGMNANQRGGKYGLDLNTQRLMMGATTLMENVRLNGITSGPEASLNLQWDNNAKDITQQDRGDIALQLQSSDSGNLLNVTQGDMNVGNNRWKIENTIPIFFSGGTLSINDLCARCADQSLRMKAMRHHDSNDFAEVLFEDFHLQQFAPLLQKSGLSLGGILKGNVDVMGLNETPYFRANLRVDSTMFGGQQLGDTRIVSNWDSKQDQISLYLTTALNKETGTTAPVMAEGVLDVSNPKVVGLNFNVLFDEFKLQTLQPLVRSAVSEMRGGLRGQFSIKGTTKQPVVTGVAYIDSGAALVDKLNVRYTFNDSIALNNDEILFNHFALHDPHGNTAYVNGRISHNYLHDFNFDLSLASDNILLLNTTAKQSDYYGVLYAAVDGKLEGELSDLDVRLQARTQRGSSMVLPFNQKRSVQDVDYIQFVSPTDNAFDNRKKRDNKGVSQNQYNLLVNLQVTPDVQMQMPVDFSQIYAGIKSKGKGDLEMRMSTGKPLSVIGDYEIVNGDLDLTILILLTKSFTIEEGSVITFPGALSDALFDIKAIYSQRVNLSTLTGSVTSTTNSQTNVQVENVIALSGSLLDPAINFDLRLPNADQSLQDEVFSYIDRSSEKDMMNQTMSLLLLKQFYNANSSDATAAAGGTNMVANTVGGVMSDMIEFVNVNFDYRQGTELTTNQFEMDVNREWNKFYFEGAFGYGGEAREMSDVNNVNNLTGDMLLGYKFSPMFHGYVFNRSNTNDYTRSDLPYKQGMGIKFMRDYDRMGDLFRSNKRIQEKNLERRKRKTTVATPPHTENKVEMKVNKTTVVAQKKDSDVVTP